MTKALSSASWDQQCSHCASEDEILEAEVIDSSSNGKRRARRWRSKALQPLTIVFVAAVVLSVIGGYIGSMLFSTTEDLASRLLHAVELVISDDSGDDGASATPVGYSAYTEDGLKVRVIGTQAKPLKNAYEEPMIIVVLELQNAGNERLAVRNWQFSALDANGGHVGAREQATSRNGGPFYQFTSTVIDQGEQLIVRETFYERSDVAQVVYKPFVPSKKGEELATRFEIGEAEGAVGSEAADFDGAEGAASFDRA